MKKLLSILLALIMSCGCFAITGYAAPKENLFTLPQTSAPETSSSSETSTGQGESTSKNESTTKKQEPIAVTYHYPSAQRPTPISDVDIPITDEDGNILSTGKTKIEKLMNSIAVWIKSLFGKESAIAFVTNDNAYIRDKERGIIINSGKEKIKVWYTGFWGHGYYDKSLRYNPKNCHLHYVLTYVDEVHKCCSMKYIDGNPYSGVEITVGQYSGYARLTVYTDDKDVFSSILISVTNPKLKPSYINKSFKLNDKSMSEYLWYKDETNGRTRRIISSSIELRYTDEGTELIMPFYSTDLNAKTHGFPTARFLIKAVTGTDNKTKYILHDQFYHYDIYPVKNKEDAYETTMYDEVLKDTATSKYFHGDPCSLRIEKPDNGYEFYDYMFVDGAQSKFFIKITGPNSVSMYVKRSVVWDYGAA